MAIRSYKLCSLHRIDALFKSFYSRQQLSSVRSVASLSRVIIAHPLLDIRHALDKQIGRDYQRVCAVHRYQRERERDRETEEEYFFL